LPIVYKIASEDATPVELGGVFYGPQGFCWRREPVATRLRSVVLGPPSRWEPSNSARVDLFNFWAVLVRPAIAWKLRLSRVCNSWATSWDGQLTEMSTVNAPAVGE